MKILLIQPKMNKRPMDTDLKTRMAPSLALLTLMRLTPQEHDVILLNENIETIDFNCKPDLVGITITLDVMPRACRIAKKFQEMSVPVIAGGIHVTCCPESCQPYFNAICIGVAERVWKQMIDDVLHNSLRQVYCDMDGFQGSEIASPKYSMSKSYLYTNVVTTSRGCPHRCDFCYNSCAHRIYVQRKIEDVVRDIKALKSKYIFFIDDNFIGTPSYTYELLCALRNLNLKWSAAVTTKIIQYPDLMDLMAKTGCQSLFIGFESINSDSLLDVHKANKVEQYETLIEEIHRRGIMVNASLVFGLDGDKPDVFPRTLDWLVKNRVETMTAHILTPYPGTALYKRLQEAGRITDHDLSKYNTSHVVFEPLGMTEKELYNGYLWLYRGFYSFGNIIRRIPRHKAQRKSFLLFNFLYRKFGGVTAALSKVISMRVVGRIAAFIAYHI